MTAFSFIHAADLHLGSPLSGLAARDADLARRLASAGRQAFEDLVSRAIERAVAFVVVAGDVYDGDWTDTTIGLFFARQVARLDRAGISTVLVRGNHDAESVISRAITLPPSVHIFPSNRAGTLRLDGLRVALHGRSFQSRAVEENLSLTYPAALPGWFNLGILHTSCTGHAAHETYAPCSVSDLTARGYDYWALGHIHEYAELSRDPWIVFPGNLQGRSVRECGEKGAVVVEVADGRVTGVTRLALDRARFEQISVDLADAADLRAALEAVEGALRPLAALAATRLVLVRVHLTGVTPAHDALSSDRDAVTAEIQAAAHRLHEDIWLERLKIETHRPRVALEPSGPAIDPAALLADLDRDPEFRARARAILAEIGSRMPAAVAAEADLEAEFDALCAEAEALILGRLGGRHC
ncbi:MULTISPECIES: metallophosphoesterase family protein [Methylobacterium]|uniref:DNA repair exonuclease n=1 Tax=Methylobacterium longum TaxID=767694 RepID=A0ABT8ATQ9_9HYPH|nr:MULTISPECIES: DNA repair exonuclease [Methylobacterium]MCJ2099507.1 DNA repair exonuclease [Methylobacterium sp. E-046]MDN3572683.1 DNA repair exonuclease [Methylobacterium longum]GJE12383.1 putative metallophosphoesterase YhaO [Methylobacterium longum]